MKSNPHIRAIFGALLFSMVSQAGAILPDTLNVAAGDINGDGSSDTLVLHKRSLRATGYRVHTWSETEGYVLVAPPEVRTYRGHVDTDPSLQVNAYITPGGLLQANITPGTAHDEGGYQVRDLPVMPPDDPGAEPNGTAGNAVISGAPQRVVPTTRGYTIPRVAMRRILVGVDIDSSYVASMGSLEAALALAEQRINDSDHFYARDMGLAWEISEVVVRLEGAPSSWKGFWNGNESAAPLDFNTKIRFKSAGGGGSSGRVFKAGQAFPNGHSATVGSLSPYSRSVGHEVGHGMGAGHGTGNPCVMSGSDSAIAYGTVQGMIEQMHLAPEAGTPEVIYNGLIHPRAMEDAFNTSVDTPVDMDLLENDYDGNGDTITVTSVDTTTEAGGMAEILPNGKVRYTPPAGFAGFDRFAYSITDSSGLTNPTGAVKMLVRNGGLGSHFILDETTGTAANDFGPFESIGTLNGADFDSSSVPGVIGNALHLGTGEKLEIRGIGDPLDGSLSISLWYKPDADVTENTSFIYKGGPTSNATRINTETFRGGWAIGVFEGRFRFVCEGQADLEVGRQWASLESTGPVTGGQWYHLVMVMDRGSNQLRAYVDNAELTNSPDGTTLPSQLIENYLDLRLDGNQPCVIDDLRLFNKTLDAVEVAGLFAATGEIPAGAPSPANRAEDAIANTTLSWLPGIPGAYPEFDLYLGTDEAAVAGAGTSSPEYLGRQSALSYASTTAGNVTYFWRVDEVKADSTIVPGRVWRFTTSDRFLLDGVPANPSFESPVIGSPGTQVNSVTGWFEEGSFTNTVREDDVTFPLTSSGANWCELGNSKWIYQPVGFYQENVTIGVAGFIGRKSGATYRGIYVRLYAGGDPQAAGNGVTPITLGATLLAESPLIKPALADLESDSFEVTFNTGTGFPVGATLWLEIRQQGGGGRAMVDDIEIFDPSSNRPPRFVETPLLLPAAEAGTSYASSLAGTAIDPEDGPLFFSKVSGPVWLNVTLDGTLEGDPETDDIGIQGLVIRVTDGEGASATTTASLPVLGALRLIDLAANFATGEITLSWGDTGGPYVVEASPDLRWLMPTQIPVDAANGTITIVDGTITFQFTESPPLPPKRFYRVRRP